MLTRIKLIAVLAITVLLVGVGVLNLRDRLGPNTVPTDGITWEETADGLRVKTIDANSPLTWRVKKGDLLRAVYFVSKRPLNEPAPPLEYEQVRSLEVLQRYLDRQGVGGDARYAVEHPDTVLQSIYKMGDAPPVFDVDFRVAAAPRYLERSLYLAFIGLVYLGIGLFVLFRQNRAELTYHFYSWSLLSFIVYFYSATLEFTPLDRLVSLLDNAALALLAPVFLHLCANFPTGRRLSRGARFGLWLLYLPGLALVALDILWHYQPTVGVFAGGGLIRARNLLDSVAIGHLAAYFIAGGALLVRTFVRAGSPLLRQQLKWIVWGIALAGLPFAALYAVPYVSQIEITPLMETLAYGPLILIPLSFGYSIVRFRLMDVDVIVRRSFVHAMATLAVAAIYMAVLLAVSDFVKFVWATADLNAWKTRVVVVVGMLIVAMLFAPIKNKLNEWADRWFYGARYTLRTGLQDFGRTLAQTTALPQLLDSLVRRLADMLSVHKVAIFIEEPLAPSGFRLAHSSGIESEITLPDDIKQSLRLFSIGRGFITAADLRNGGDGDEAVGSDELAYYVPCVVRDRMVALIGVGRTTAGAMLTSEDTELLRALSGYVAVAIDNALLYRSEMEKAGELARLKEFSENIIESVNVGILAVDFDGYVTTWNSALEEITGIARERALRRSVADVLDRDLIETVQAAVGDAGWTIREARHIYKYNTTTEDGRPLTLNISIAPFEAAHGVVTGALIVLENVTERAQLEEQLMQREKLSSIGLLAAGVAHEVNTPLTGISSFTQMLLQQVPPEDPTTKVLEKIERQTFRAAKIVNGLLNLARPAQVDSGPCDINVVINDVLSLLEHQFRTGSIQVRKELAATAPI
ncbi:MAG TPA: PAS domain S-box protein, partial [Blastocatellia bacterium]|nr:PAS domain S-box protein [Blastocatellia bacterium]